MPIATLAAPAKINLHLEILGRRDDGFHALETVFQTLELADQIGLELIPGASGIRLDCRDPSIPNGPDNLAWKAAAGYLARRPGLGQVAITLDKLLPHGAGLGGGSSDAAAVLRGLTALDPEPLPGAELATLALELGSDVPFFLLGGTAHATGRGEELTALTNLPRQPLTVFMPGAILPTPAVFRALTPAERAPRQARGAAWFAQQPIENWLHNRLEAPARRLCPEVDRLLEWLEKQSVPHLMTGSGAACIALAHLDPPPQVRAWWTWTGGPVSPVTIRR